MNLATCCISLLTVVTLVKSEHDLIVVVGGFTSQPWNHTKHGIEKGFSHEVEVFDPHPNITDPRVCNTAYLSPDIASDNGIGGLINGRVTFCGGQRDWHQNISTCYRYDPENTTWTNFSPMNMAREDAAYVTTPYGLMVAGQRERMDENNIYIEELNSAEYFNGTQWLNLPKLPFISTRACMAQINKTHTIHMGKNNPFSIF